MDEHEIQKYAVMALRKIGFTCCVTSNRKKTSNTRGTPDVFVNISNYHWTALEFKQPDGKVSKTQKQLVDNKLSYIVTSAEEAVLIAISLKRRAYEDNLRVKR